MKPYSKRSPAEHGARAFYSGLQVKLSEKLAQRIARVAERASCSLALDELVRLSVSRKKQWAVRIEATICSLARRDAMLVPESIVKVFVDRGSNFNIRSPQR
jgi:hypothetical protein